MSRAAVSILGLSLLVGCGVSQPYVTSARLERGLLIVLPGIEGRSPVNKAICRGLDAGGVDWAIELYDWTSPLGPLYNLRAEARNREMASRIANRVVRYQLSYPDRPVVLVGQSGGGAMAVWVAEAMPPAHTIDGLITLAATLSPQYMLDGALIKTRRGIVSFYSPSDWLLLGVGTAISGTMDGEHTASAGRTGFKTPAAGLRRELYRKLLEVAWREDMARTGYTGGHLSSGQEKFIAAYVAPFVLSEQWNIELIDRVPKREQAETAPSEPPLIKRQPQPTSAP